MKHWLRVGGMRINIVDEVKQWENIKSYLNDFPGSKAEVYYSNHGDRYFRYVCLECNQTYSDLDLLCNSGSSGSVDRLERKPSNLLTSGFDFEYHANRKKNLIEK